MTSLIPDLASLLASLFTISSTIFIAELTDKDALLLLTLATRMKPWTAFVAGSTAFTTSTAIIVAIGYFLVRVIPVFYVRIGGALVMIGFAVWQYTTTGEAEEKSDEKRLIEQTERQDNNTRNIAWSIFFGAVALLIILDLAGDATEVLTIVYVARFSNAILVFVGAVIALVSASAVEVTLGNRLKNLLSPKRIRILSLLVFLVIGSVIILTTVF